MYFPSKVTGVLIFYECIVIANGFVDVGVYSKLQAAQFFYQSGTIQGWKTTGSPGLNSHDAVYSSASFSDVKVPIQGIYYASTTLILQTTDANTSLKTSILVNNDPKRKTGLTSFESTNGSVTITGLAQLMLQDSLSVHIEFQNGSTWTVSPESTFFVQLIYSLTTYPAFQAVLSRDSSKIPASIWRRVEGWNTTTSGFQVLSGFSPSIGTFCASCDGIYSIHGNIVLDSRESKNGSVGLFFQNKTMISEEYFSGGKMHTSVSAGGIFYLKKGECVDVRTRSSQGPHTVIEGSGFSLFYLSSEAKPLHAGSYRLDTHAPSISTAGLYPVSGWTTDGSSVFFASSPAIMVTNRTRYEVQTDGQYLISAHVNFKSLTETLSESIQLLIIIDKSSSSGLSNASIVAKEPISVMTSLSINGILFLSKGQTISLCVYKDGDTLVTPLADSLFSVAMVPKDWPAVSATLSNDQLITRQGWNELGGWETGNFANGLFSFDGAFQPVSGRYVVPLEGTYIVSCIININGTIKQPLEVMIAVNSKLDATSGLRSIQHSGKGHVTMSTVGSIWLLPGQYLSVFVHVGAGTSWTIKSYSSFTVSLNGAGKVDRHGFSGVKTQSDDHTTIGWKEVKGWQPRDSSDQSEGTWDPTLSKFTPDEDGLYLITANLILSHSAVSQFHALIISDGESNKFSAGQNYQSVSDLISSPSKVSLPVSCSIKLTKSQYVSIYVQSKQAVSWSIEGNSSISIVLVSTLTNPHRAGINAVGRFDTLYGTRYNMIRKWYYTASSKLHSVYREQINFVKDINLLREYIQVDVSGLYFMEVAILVEPRSSSSFGPYTLALCIETKATVNALQASKLTEGPSTTDKFGVSIFGLVYLTRGQQVYPCIAGVSGAFRILVNAGLSVVKIVPRGINPGLRQTADSDTLSSRDWTVVSDWTSKGKTSLYKHGEISSHGDADMKVSKGTHFLSSSFVLKVNDSTAAKVCVGQDQCNMCYLQGSVNNGGVTVAGSVRFQTQQSMYTCVNRPSVTVARSAQILPQAGQNTTFFYRHDRAMFSSPGVKPLNSWTSDDGRSHTGITVTLQGLYVISVNGILRSSTDTSVKVLVNLITKDKSSLVPGLNVPITWLKASEPMAFGLSSLVRIPAGNSLSVNVYSDSSTSWETDANATFSAALVTKDSSFQGVSVRKSRDSTLTVGSNWLAVEGWDGVNTGAVSSSSVVHRGQFVVDTTGIYLVMETLSVSVPVSSDKECTIELLISIDGDVLNSNSLRMSRVLKGQHGVTSRTTTLSLSSSVYLSKWQAVFPMVRSTSAQKIVLLSDSSFYVALVDKQRHFSQHCDDTGPHITLHPPPLLRVASDACQTISLHCEAVSSGKITYQWLKNNQFLAEKSPKLVINNARLSDAGRYMCEAESYNVSVTSYPSIVEVIETRPMFTQSQFNVSVNETSSSLSLLVLNFTALTLKEERANVSFVIVSGNTNDIFTLNPSISTSETILTNTSPLDFEQDKEYRLNIKATNTATRQSLDILVTITIEDVNDNYPVFTPQSYATSIPEKAWKGALILQVTTIDVDSGDNSKVTYNITGGNIGGVFDINPANGIVFVNNTLDYESNQSYNLTIEARDLGHPSLQSRDNAHVTIRITDSNDNNPVFSVSTYNFSVAEDSGNGWVVGRVHATDRDKAENGRVIYGIQDTEMLKTFSINKTSGEISLNGDLDYEVTNVYELLVTAVDQGTHPRSGAVLVHISVRDVNDNFPIFDPKAYSVDVTEATIVGTDILCVYAGDKDSGLRGDVRYTITEGDTEGTFRVTARGSIVLNRTLDREHKQSYNLTITATDRGSPPKTSHDPCRVEIHVGDVNDNFPQFPASMYNTTLPENASIGYDVIRVQATDDDIGSNALITYHMDTSCYSSRLANQTLTVNQTTGVVYTTKEIDFDILQDDDKSIRFRVEAKDGGSPSLKSFVEVVVMVTDVNDNPPVFNNLPKIVSIRDDTPESEAIFTVIAKDSDYGSNAQVRYSIEELKEIGVVIPNQDAFRIDANSGRVFATKAFKKEYRTEFELVIQARDLGSPPLSSRSSLSIRVNDANDHKPAFEKLLYKRSFSTPPAINSLLFTVNASDQDIGNNSVIDYNINLVNATESTCQANFSIASNGSIYNNYILTAECEYKLQVDARDRGQPPLTGTCYVTITIEAGSSTSGKSTDTLSRTAKITYTVVFIIIAIILLVVVGFMIKKYRRRKSKKELTQNITLKSVNERSSSQDNHLQQDLW